MKIGIVTVNNVFAETKPAKVAVFLLDFTDDLISAIGENLKNIQKENPGTVEYTYLIGNQLHQCLLHLMVKLSI